MQFLDLPFKHYKPYARAQLMHMKSKENTKGVIHV